MNNWSSEIEELKDYYKKLSGKVADLEKELARLIKVEDEIGILVSSRRCLEVIVNDICKKEEIKLSKTIPLKGIIDKLNKEDKAPEHIISSMLNLNSISTYGAHAKEFDTRQVKSALNNLTIIVDWYLKYERIDKEIIEKTASKQDLNPSDSGSSHKNKRIPFIFITTIIVIGVVIVLAFDLFHLFNREKFKNLRDEKGRISIAVMPFQNMTRDTLWDIWQDGIQNELISQLSNSEELSVRKYQTILDILSSKNLVNYASITPSVAGDLSRKLDVSTFVLGSIKRSGGTIRLSAQLVDSETEEIYKTFQAEGKSESDVFKMIDSLTVLVKNYLEIKSLSEGTEEAQLNMGTNSAVAFKYYIVGVKYFWRQEYSTSIDLLNKAIETDSTFIGPYVFLAIAYGNNNMIDEAKSLLQKLNKQKPGLSYKYQLYINWLNALYGKDPQKSIQYFKQIVENEPTRSGCCQLGWEYYTINQFEKAVQWCEKSLEMDKKFGGNWKWLEIYTVAGLSYHKLGNHKREREIYELALKNLPDNPDIIYVQAVCELSQGDSLKGKEYIDNFVSVTEKEGWGKHRILNNLGMIYEDAGNFKQAEKYFKDVENLNPDYLWSKVNLARLYFQNDTNINEGMELVDQALSVVPDNYYINYIKGLGLIKMEKNEEALKFLNKSWDQRSIYNHEHYVVIQEVKAAIKKQSNE